MSDIVYYAACCLLAAGVLAGIAMMSKVETSVKGNALSAVCTAIAILLTMVRYNIISDYTLWICVAAGLVAGLIWCYRIKMIEMPQTVALLNGLGGAASAIVAAISVLEITEKNLFALLTAGLALGIGTITLTGSLVAAGKLHKLLPQKPVIWKRHRLITTVSICLTIVSVASFGLLPTASLALKLLTAGCAIISGIFGVVFTIRVGGADMPITISLLNSLSGVAGAIAGMAVSDLLLIAIGGIVGASGLLLTQIMCRAMNRSLADIILGKTSTATVKAVEANGHSCRSDDSGDPPKAADVQSANLPEEPEEKDDPVRLLSEAKKVIIVPGYGMALAQAQNVVKKLVDKLEASGADVMFAIHPVAGRMPGHMNVLLCEVDIPYDKLHEMDEINPMFAECDVAVVIGANDVINPAANTAEGTPIYGMPVLDVNKAKHIIICNYDLKPGYAGVENPLYSMSNGVTMLLGNAKETLSNLLAALEQA